ncbi:MAG: DUF1501 domain-containing protein [Woeseia sp.]
MVSRRELLRQLGLGAMVTSLPGISFAKAETDARFVLVILRGAADGLAIAAPYGEGRYRSVRGELAIPAPGTANGLLELDGLFGLHPSLSHIHDLYGKDAARLVHAVASPDRDRSHCDGQDVLENGVTSAGGKRDGWLNRALAPLGGSLGNEPAIALSQNTPLVLRGANSVTSWAPSQLPDADEDTLRRITALYSQDEFFATRLAQALESQEIAGELDGMQKSRRRGNDAARFEAMMVSAGKFLTADGGPQIAVVESGGWDTHANQGSASGALANRLAGLDKGLDALREQMGASWPDTVIAVVTEFGRTVKVNGTRGTDHGTATAALVLGGAVEGGRIVADWPGLETSSLYQGRDLYPTTDLRSLFKGILWEHLRIPPSWLDNEVFPGSASAPMTEGLIQS